MDIEKAITEGIVFKGGKSPSGKQEDKVKTKAKKKSYITGLHGSGAVSYTHLTLPTNSRV